METNENLREQIFVVIKNQMEENNPPETNKTYNRLIKEGYSDFEAKQLIGQCVAVELYNLLKHSKPFDEKRYVRNLKQLPEKPVE
ncbi:MAG: DUF1841 family protein [Bacteroidales bacterium]